MKGDKNMKMLNKEIDSCVECLQNKHGMCYELSKPLKNLCFELDCPLPTLNDVEKLMHHITKDKSTNCHGNCKNWTKWGFNKHLKTFLGVCNKEDTLTFVKSSGSSCEEFEDVLGDEIGA